MTIDFTQGEAKEALDKAVSEAIEQATAGLKNKNDELLREKKALETKFEGVDADEYRNLKTKERDEGDKGLKDAKQLRERIEAEFTPKLDSLKKERDDARSELKTFKIDNAVTDALNGINVSKDLMPAAKALLLSSRKVEINDGGVVIDGKSASAFAQEWAGTDGKAFIAAQNNTGGGAKGSNGAGGGAAGGKKASEMSRTEKVTFIKEHGEAAWAQKIKES